MNDKRESEIEDHKNAGFFETVFSCLFPKRGNKSNHSSDQNNQVESILF